MTKSEIKMKLTPVAKVVDWGIEGPKLQGLTNDWPSVGTLLFTYPPKKRFVGLTEEDFVCVNQLCDTPIQAAEYVEHLLKERND